METLLYIIFFLSCIVLVVAVLLQPGKTDAGALFTSGVSSAALNPRGTQSVLSKLTIGAACLFMITALLLSLPAITGSRSVLDTAGSETPPTGTTPAATTNSNTEGATESNTATEPKAEDKEEGKSEESTDSKEGDKSDKSDEESKADSADKKETETEKKEESSDEKKEDDDK